MSAAAGETSWIGETSMKWTSSGGVIGNSPFSRQLTRRLWKAPRASSGSLACAMTYLSSTSADRYSTCFETTPSRTFR